MPYCPKCGAELEEGQSYCPACGARLGAGGERRRVRASGGRAMDHLSLGFNLAMEKPMVFAPVVIGGLISVIIDNFWGGSAGQTEFVPILFVVSIVSIIGSIVIFILNFATIDMARDAYTNQPLDLGRSFSYAMSRILTFIVASIAAALLSITIILIPVAILMMVIIVMDETGIMDAVSQAFSVLTRDLGDIIVILIASIIGYALLGWVPLIGDLLTACFGVVIDLAFIDVYHQYRSEFTAF